MNLIDEAIVEAKMLREEARKMAEQEVLERYAPKIKKSIDKILNEEDINLDNLDDSEDNMDMSDLGAAEGDDMDMSMDDSGGLGGDLGIGGIGGIGGGAGGGDIGSDALSGTPMYDTEHEAELPGDMDAEYDASAVPSGFGDGLATGDDEQVELEFPDIMSALSSDDDEIGSDVFDSSETEDHMDMADEVVGLDENTMAAGAVEGGASGFAGKKYKNLNDVEDPDSEELYYITDDDVEEMSDDYISELLSVDYEPVPSGKPFAGTNDSEEDTETLKRKIKTLEDDKKELVAENIKSMRRLRAIEKNAELLEAKIVAASKHLKESNKKNAKLFYTNCVLNNVSLNERQKRTFAAKILSAESVAQAKVLYEACINMASTGTSGKNNTKDSLNESLRDTNTRSTSKRRLQESENIDVNFRKMWQKKAGIITDNGDNDDE